MTALIPKIGMRITGAGITCCGSHGCGSTEPMPRVSSGVRACTYCDCAVQYDGLTITRIERCKNCR